MLENIFKTTNEKVEPVQTIEPGQIVKVPANPIITPVVKTTPAPKVCTNCDNSGLTCSACGFNKP